VSFIERLREFDNLLVMRTLSKQGLAALRLGLLVGAPAWLAEFDKVRLPYNINSLTQASAEFALNNPVFYRRKRRACVRTGSNCFLPLNLFLVCSHGRAGRILSCFGWNQDQRLRFSRGCLNKVY